MRQAQQYRLQLIEVAQKISPALRALVVDSAPAGERLLAPPYLGGSQQVQSAAWLYQSIATGHPEAGKIYWQTRSWTLMNWQPIALLVLSHYLFGYVPRLAGFKQQCSEQMVAGYWLPEDAYVSVFASSAVVAGRQLAQLSGGLYDAAAASFSLSRSLSKKLLADSIEHSLRLLWEHQDDLDLRLGQDTLAEQLDAWLLGAGLQSQQREYRDDPLRRACCMEYRLDEGDYCGDCPCRPKSEADV
ncbi:(2Fe-2S)-binding protein [Aliagarivorans marinus]|uniref:(2Fe-2S)-binding protein n=1 Tax=Aliagarivorans marinus TaxID=561965 RepID=UPI0004050EFE|nr:(2Fe-2S)-binding protein [Aliagarivorans marinus]